MDTKTDSKQQIPGTLVLLENGRFTEPGKIQKRPGNTALSQSILGSSSSISSGTGLASFKDELLASDGTDLYSYSDGNNSWVDKGTFFTLGLSTSSVIKNQYQQTSQDSCYHYSGLQCFVWEDSSGGSRYSIIDYATKLQVVSNQIITSDAVKPKCYALGNYFVILYHDTSDGNINKMVIPAVAPTTSGVISSCVTDISGTIYDAQMVGSRLMIAYNNATGGINLRYLNTSLSISSAQTIASNVASCIACFGDDSSNVWVAFWNGTVIKTAVWDYNLTAILSVTTGETVANVKNITGAAVGTTARLFYDITNGTSYNYKIKSCTVTVAGSFSSADNFILSLSLGTKAFNYNGVIYVTGSYASTYQPTYFVLNSSAKVVAKVAPLQGGGIPAKAVLPQVNLISEGVYEFPYLIKNTATAVNGVISSQSNLSQAILDFTNTGIISSELASNLHIGGGYLTMYDGANLVEHGFHLFPEQVSCVESGGGSIAAGTYQYCACYEWTDNFGNIHRSAPSVPVTTITTGSNKIVTVTIPTLRVTSKSSVTCVVYRTEASGTVFYRVSSFTSPTFNSTSADTVSFADSSADATIIGNNQLYTTGGEVENISVPATDIFVNFKGRIIAVPSENRGQWWYSKYVIPGSPVEFSDLFVNNMDQYGGDIRAVGVSDDKLVFFKENTKFFVYGNGPSANGANNDFSNPERITGDTGCVNQRSIVSTPMGLMYQSPKGIYLLDRALVDKYIGAPVEQYTQNATVTSSILLASVNQVRFTLNTGISIVYDYYVDQWAIDRGIRAIDSALWKGETYSTIRSNGQVLIEDSSVSTDAGRFISLKMKTGWINLAQVNGFQRLWKMLLLGEYLSPHNLIVSVAENFNDSPFQQTYIDGDLSSGNFGDDVTFGESDYYGGAFPYYQFRVFLERQKCTSIQITIEDSPSSSNYGASYSLSNILFECGIKRGAFKLPAAQSYG